jgi:Tfp pilus assembly protein PilO
MKNTWKRRWITLASVWCVAIFFTYYNWKSVDAVTEGREEHERFKSELRFQQEQSDRLSKIVKSSETLFLNVESVPLGLISIRGELTRFAEKGSLNVAALTLSANQNPEEGIPCHISLLGRYSELLHFLRSVEREPYYQVKKFQLQRTSKNEEISLELSLEVFIKILDGPRTIEPSMLANGQVKGVLN